MQGPKGIFIVIDGIDGTGKSTQFELLQKRLEEAGYSVLALKFPLYEKPSSYFVREYLQGKYGPAGDVGPYAASLFYALDRYQASLDIRKALEQGKVVLCDRFTPSNMIHQGAKLDNAEQRRGYYLWLDNLEHETLGIPRPTITYILQAPFATVTERLQAKRQSDSRAKKDIHETDAAHLRRALEVSAELCELYPKDFARIDSAQGEAVLGVEAVHELLWEKVSTLLPTAPAKAPKPDKPTVRAAAVAAAPTITADAPPTGRSRKDIAVDIAEGRTTARPTSLRLTIRHAPDLLTAKIISASRDICIKLPAVYAHADTQDKQGRYRFYIPRQLDLDAKQHYIDTLHKIFSLYAKMVSKLTAHLAAIATTPEADRDKAWRDTIRVKACKTASAVLPVATEAAIDIDASSEALEGVARLLINDDLPEARTAGQHILGAARGIVLPLLEGNDTGKDSISSDHSTVRPRLKQLAETYLPKYQPTEHAANTGSVILTDFWPRNELAILPDILYKFSSQSLDTITQEVDAWPYQKKVTVFRAYLDDKEDHRDGGMPVKRALERIHYSWDVLSSYGAFRSLQGQHVRGNVAWQPLAPHYGHTIPKLITETGLTKDFERCFELSHKLYTALHEAGYPDEAQYATLIGHRMRWRITCNGRDTLHLRTDHAIARQMHDTLAEVHPHLAEYTHPATTGQKSA